VSVPQFTTDPLPIAFRSPEPGPDGEIDNFIVGAWHPERSLRLTLSGAPGVPITWQNGPNWFMASAAAPRDQRGLVHPTPEGGCVALRGYLLPGVHSYSPAETILRRVRETAHSCRRGIFSLATVSRDGASLELGTDTLGVGTMYWRRLGQLVLFGTNPRDLAHNGDEPDRFAARCLMQTSWIGGDRSLTRGVQRVPAGCHVTFAAGARVRVSEPTWRSLPGGTRPMGVDSLPEIEHAFQQAVDSCLTLFERRLLLPLSSGFDSRRILGGLLRRGIDFVAVTGRVLQREHRDLDARFASAMARDFGFHHRVVDADLAQFLVDDRVRRSLMDAESHEHTWALRVIHAMPGEFDAILDGVGGDILGDPVGWLRLIALSIDNRAGPKELDAIVANAIRGDFDGILSAARR